MTTNNNSSSTPIPNFYRASAADFKKIPGSPIAYWVSEKMLQAFENGILLGKVADSKQGLATADNDRFLRLWYEVVFCNTEFNATSIEDAEAKAEKWFPYNKGGEFRKWYGNNDYIVNWENNGFEIRNIIDQKGNVRSRVQNTQYYFQECFSWSLVSSSVAAFRYKPIGHIFDVAGMSCFSKDKLLYLLALCNTKVVMKILEIIAPTINYQCGDIANIPVAYEKKEKEHIEKVTADNISLSRADWDSFETSWDFTHHPLVPSILDKEKQMASQFAATRMEQFGLLSWYFEKWKHECNARFDTLKSNEEELNRIFIDIYGLQDELTPEVADRDVTVFKIFDTKEDIPESMGNSTYALTKQDAIKSFISYAVGCMFGRYSLDKPGLVLANQGERLRDHMEQVPEPSFMPDADNIIPILEDEYFEDDIMSRFKKFLKVTFGEELISENLDFIAEALGGSGKKSSEDVIRDYFIKSFYKDHVKMYKKRPIYWLFSSGKERAFNALIYMHRYNRETLALMRTDYLLELESKLDAKRAMIKSDIGKDAQEKVKLGKMISEIMEYDELLKNKADEYIEIDLDDGVKVNYEKFDGLVEKI